ncbi:MAG: aspartate aminotransferase family protein [Candidatus Nealsonbacteria bacterium]|nr:aspartate aminotransferase family protein [Candidatus Nealsonbacteria bacterium]
MDANDRIRELLEGTAERAIRYLEGLSSRSVAPSPEAVAALNSLHGPMPDGPSSPESVLAALDTLGSPATMAMAGPRFFGFVVGGSLPAALAANWLAGAWDQNSALANVTPGTALLEQIALEWLIELFGLPPDSAGAFVTGATMANFCGLAAARHAVLARAGWNVEADGLFGAPPITVIVSDEAHPSVTKALGLLGMGRNRVVRVPVDEQGRMRGEALPPIAGPTIVCMQAGNVNTGAFDPLASVCDAAHEAGAWVHVDGAFGIWAAAVDGLRELTHGIARADSWATDAHKWLNVPYDSGLAIVRDRDALKAAMAVSAEYLPSESEGRNPSDFTPEFSRRARGVEIWAALQSLGRSGVADLIERTCRHARRFAQGFRAAGYSILNDVVLNQVLVSFGDARTTERVIEEIQADGTTWCGRTHWQGHTAMRISVSCWATEESDVEKSLEAMLRIAGR